MNEILSSATVVFGQIIKKLSSNVCRLNGHFLRIIMLTNQPLRMFIGTASRSYNQKNGKGKEGGIPNDRPYYDAKMQDVR